MKNERRENLIDTIAFSVMEAMDTKTMEIYVIDQLTDYYNQLDNILALILSLCLKH